MLDLLDFLTAVIRPLAWAWDQEFGEPDADRRPPAPASVTLSLTVTAAPAPACVISDAPEAEQSATVADCSASATTPPAEPLFVRRGSGRGARYIPAGPEVTGDRWRRVVRGKRASYEPAGRAGR